MDKSKVMWMEVSFDKYQLPLVVANTAGELAKICGVSRGSIYSWWNHYRAGDIKKTRYVRVEFEEEQNEE